MKHLLNGVAIAAALAIATPVWAQAPTSTAPAAPAAAPAAPMAGMPAPSAKQRHHRRPMRHMARRGMMRSGEASTQQLNREELSRVQGMSAPPPPPPTFQGPRPSGH